MENKPCVFLSHVYIIHVFFFTIHVYTNVQTKLSMW